METTLQREHSARFVSPGPVIQQMLSSGLFNDTLGRFWLSLANFWAPGVVRHAPQRSFGTSPPTLPVRKVLLLAVVALVTSVIALAEQNVVSKLPDGWKQLGADYFTVYAPARKFRKMQGVDSYVGAFAGDGVQLEFPPAPAQNLRPLGRLG